MTHEADEARKLAMRYNNLTFALFGAWLAMLPMFWLRAFGPLLSFDATPIDAPVAVLFAASLASALLAAKLPGSYYRPRSFETRALYRRLGIREFRAVMSDGDMINRHVRTRHPGYVVHRGDGALAAAVERGMRSERAHHVLFWFGLGTSACAAIGGWYGWATAIGLGNLVGNLYPMMLQRYTRGRLMRARPRLVTECLEGAHA